uniref:Uncharacterized protein n=1 Tax=Rhizophora mucronata TaxID=61149 RepID=A0A2P2IWB5_RHIMU
MDKLSVWHCHMGPTRHIVHS